LKGALEGKVIHTDPAAFIEQTVRDTGVPAASVQEAMIQRRQKGLPVTAGLIKQDYIRTLRQAKKAAAVAAVRKAPPPPPPVPAFATLPSGSFAAATLKKLVDEEVTKVAKKQVTEKTEEEAVVLKRIQDALGIGAPPPIVTPTPTPTPVSTVPVTKADLEPADIEEAQEKALEILEARKDKVTQAQIDLEIERQEDRIVRDKEIARKDALPKLPLPTAAISPLQEEFAVPKPETPAETKARRAKIRAKAAEIRKRLIKKKVPKKKKVEPLQALREAVKKKPSEEVAVLTPTIRQLGAKVEETADLWDVAYQGGKKGENVVDKKKQAAFIRHVNQFKDTADPAVTDVIFDTVSKVFTGDEGTDVRKLQIAVWYTALHESFGYKFRKQKGGGPARGIHQVEPATALSLIKNSALLGPTAVRHLKAEGLDITKKPTKIAIALALQRSDVVSTIFATAKLLSGAKASGRIKELQ